MRRPTKVRKSVKGKGVMGERHLRGGYSFRGAIKPNKVFHGIRNGAKVLRVMPKRASRIGGHFWSNAQQPKGRWKELGQEGRGNLVTISKVL